jgi:hypothetical protein
MAKAKSKGEWVVVLNDGETYTTLGGCKLMFIPAKAIDVTNQSEGADDFYDDVEEKLGQEVAQQILEVPLDTLLENPLGYIASLAKE